MRELKPLSWLMVLFVGTAFAADGVVPSRVILSSGNAATSSATSTQAEDHDTTRNDASVASRTATRTISRTVSNATKSVDSTASGAARGAVNTSRGGIKTTASKQTDINDNPAVRRAGLVLRPSVAEFGGRAIIAGTDKQTGSNIADDIRKVTGRATTTVATKESIAEAKEVLEQTAELNTSCQQQYNECMDQFCAVIDANQKRCSCSANLSKYKKVEDAVNEANTKLNDVAQNIRYIGLSADEIRAIMTATEAEEALSGTRDNTENRNMLEQIEKMIKDPTSSSYSSYSSTDFGIDMDLDFSSDATDIFSLDFLKINDTNSFSNLRGTELYNTAKKRCNTVLNQCKQAGATIQQVTGNYDLAIDKDCIAYEAGLKKMNETLVSNVRSAERMLQKARLAVLQNKNQYDAKGCVGALETCMTDDMVCGDDYSKCVDPTKRFIDENGEVVLGQDITRIQAFMSKYNNASIKSSFLSDAYGTTVDVDACSSGDGNDGRCVVKYLIQKIGTKQKATDEGLCRPVLDKCQAYTYSDGKYKPYNDIVVNYIQRAMVNIKAAQQQIISDYASECMADVAACYNQQVTQVNAWSSVASADDIYRVMRGACRSVALTCGFAIFTGEPEIPEVVNVGANTYNVSGCTEVNNTTYGSDAYNGGIINCVSNIFYQTLLCPDNSTYQITSGTPANNGADGGYVNERCKCNSGYAVWNGHCLVSCGDNASRNMSSGSCECNTGYSGNGYTCTANTTQNENEGE